MLFHFSEDPDIARFLPHVPRTNSSHAPAVWAIDEEHSPLYWFPRDCPRVTAWPRNGEWVSDHAVEPLAVAPIGDLLVLHRDAGIELRVVDNLWPSRDLAHRGPWDFSTVRMGNARPRETLA